MKKIIKILCLILFGCVCFGIFSSCVVSAVSSQDPSYLFIGRDESSENTDVLITVTYSRSDNAIRAIQIPRDTYIRTEIYEGKINGIYPSVIAKGKSHDEASNELLSAVSDAIGISLDGYVSLNKDLIVKLVDRLGGIDITVREEFADIFGDKYKIGSVVKLDGEQSYRLIRHRKSYSRGDLQRIEMQRYFAKALFNKMISVDDMPSVVKDMIGTDGLYFEIDAPNLIALAIKYGKHLKNADFAMATLPGKAVEYNSNWIYLVNMPKSKALVNGYFENRYIGFDKTKKLLNKNRKSFEQIYFSENFIYG